MGTYYHIEHLMEFWKLTIDETLEKIAKEIRKDKDYYYNCLDPILAVKKKVIFNRRYNVLRTGAVPRISIRDNKTETKLLRFKVNFFNSIFSGNRPSYVKITMINKKLIKLIFSYSKDKGFLKISKPSGTSKKFGQICINGFLNFHNIKISDIEGDYDADKGFKRDLVDGNVFYLYIDERT